MFHTKLQPSKVAKDISFLQVHHLLDAVPQIMPCSTNTVEVTWDSLTELLQTEINLFVVQLNFKPTYRVFAVQQKL